jgi:hypothetical protein
MLDKEHVCGWSDVFLNICRNMDLNIVVVIGLDMNFQMRNYWGLVNLMHYLLRCEKMFGKYIMKKTQQKRRGGKTQKRRGGKTQKRRAEMKRKVMRGGVVFTKEKRELLQSLGGIIEQHHRSIINILSINEYSVSIGGKPFYIKKHIYEPRTYDTPESNKQIVYNYAVEFDYECDSKDGKDCPFVVYFENLANCIKAINSYYGLTPLLNINTFPEHF